MKTYPRWLVAVVAAAAVTLALDRLTSQGDDQVQPIPVQAPERHKKDVRTFMLAKLNHSQNVLEGLVRKDFAKIQQGAEALKLTSLGTPKLASGENHDDEVFEHFKTEFLRLAFRLEQLAESKNLEGSAYVAQQLNATCIACHQYLRDELSPAKNE